MWKLFTWIKKKNAEAEKMIGISEGLVTEIISKSTNAERRGDIFLYITLKALKANARRHNADMMYWGVSAVMLWLLSIIIIKGADPLLNFSNPPVILFYLCIVVLVVSMIMVIMFDRFLRRFEKKWNDTVENILHEKIQKHLDA